MTKKHKQIKSFDIYKINSPDFVKDLNYKELDVLCSNIRDNILENVSKYGGHLSSNLGVVEATVALHRNFDFKKDILIFDVGHQCYTHKILTGRSLLNLRHSDGVSGFQKRNESIYDKFEAGHSSTSISAANGFAIARDLHGEKYDVVAFIGDSSIVNGLAFEGLNNLAQDGHKVIIVLNDNEMAISKATGAMGKFFRRIANSSSYNKSKNAYKRLMYKTRFGSKIYNLTLRMKNSIKRHVIPTTMFDNMGLCYLGPIDGHNIAEIDKALRHAKQVNRSVVVHLKTIKGKGYVLAQNDTLGLWHGVSPFVLENGFHKKRTPGSISWSHLYAILINDEMAKNKSLFLITPAMIVGSELSRVFQSFPERCLDVGIAEEHALTLASGLALAGEHPIISIYSTFLQRAFDELSHDLARQRLNATLIIDRAGLIGADGDTHQGIYDESFLISTPNTVVSMASNEDESRYLFHESINNHGVFAIRIPRDYVSVVDNKQEQHNYEFGKWIEIQKNSSYNLALVSLGPIIREIETKLKEENISITIVNALYQKPFDEEYVDKELMRYKTIIVHNAYATSGGFSNLLLATLLKKGYKGKVIALTVKDEFIPQGSIKEQMIKQNVDVDSVIKAIKEN